MRLTRGELFNREMLLSDLLALTTLVNDEGYAQALVSPGVEKRKEYPVADVTYRFERGTKFRFGKVEISGNTKTLDRVVRHNLDVADGRTYTATGLKTSKENLTRSSYFKDVKISTAPSTVPGEMDAKVEVQEGPTGTLSGGLGYSSVDKIFGVVQLTENNLFGRGWKASLNSQFGARRTTFSIDFRDPNFLDTDFSLLLSAYNTKVKYIDFEKEGDRREGGPRIQLFAVHQRVRLPPDGSDPILPVGRHRLPGGRADEIDKGLQKTRSIGFNVTRNTTDKSIDPSRGTVQSASLEYAGGPLGGDSQFVKYFLQREVVLPGDRLHRFFVERPVGARGPDGGRRGGPAVRAVFPRGAVQHPGVPLPGPVAEGPQHGGSGRREQGTDREPGVPVPARRARSGSRGSFFSTSGTPGRREPGPSTTRGCGRPTGLGVRWYSPMGPLRFEWGWNLDRPEGQPKRVMEFTIGTAF